MTPAERNLLTTTAEVLARLLLESPTANEEARKAGKRVRRALSALATEDQQAEAIEELANFPTPRHE